MNPIDNEKFGRFLLQLRKNKNLTQKELADKLFVSDKTVSKWERGLSFPNVSLLIPLADLLGVTVTELLKGEQLHNENLDITEVEKLVTCSVDMSVKEQFSQQKRNQKWTAAFLVCALIAVAEILLLTLSGFPIPDEGENLLLVEGLMFLFSGWFCLFAKETLPSYYDENKIHFVSDGIFRLNITGLHFNNHNWPHIVNTGRIWTLAVEVLYPAFLLILYCILGSESCRDLRNILTLPITLGMFVPIYIVGKKYE